jgi:hypothetical protein
MATKPKSVSFADKFGLPKDRYFLRSGVSNFDIVKIVMSETKRPYEVTKTNEDGKKEVKMQKIPIVYLDVQAYDESENPVHYEPTGEVDKEKRAIVAPVDGVGITKFYTSSGVIVETSQDILKAYGTPEGNLKEFVRIAEVKEKTSEAGKNPYIFFT